MNRITLRVGLAVLSVAGAASVAVGSSLAQHPATQPADGAPAGSPAAAVPVGVAKATRQDVPIYVTGVGTVEAYQSVLVRARVAGP
jgi:multidrug efflux system membrane fusion protein